LSCTRLGLFGFARDATAEEDEMTTPTPFPLRGQAARMDALRAALRPLDTGNMAIHELVTVCEDAVPEATIDEIADALRQVAAEHIVEAEGETGLCRRRKGGPVRQPRLVRHLRRLGERGPFAGARGRPAGDGGGGLMPTPVLRFAQFPGIGHKETVDGRRWVIDRIEAPHCYAAPVGSDDFKWYRLEVPVGHRGFRLRLRDEQRPM
jgi:hypothetical protein